MKKIKNSVLLVLIAFLGMGIVGCNQADGSADARKIEGMVKTKLDSLTTEMAADCDRQIATAVKSKAAAMAAFKAKAVAPPVATKPAQSSSTATAPTKSSTVKKGKLSGGLSDKAKVISGTGERIKNTENKNFDPAKKKKGKLRKLGEQK